MNQKTILLTGSTGYIGGRLLHLLEEEENLILHCLVREPLYLHERFNPRTRIFKGDVLDKASIVQAMQGVDVAFYLIHSMGSEKDFIEQDRLAALNFAQAASECKVKRIIYLGGLGDSRYNLSSHLKSRQEVGHYLREQASGVQVLEFRASIIIGSGSLSFELIRSLCERLPVMLTPKWIWTMAQPIAISDILAYLNKAIEIEIKGNQIFEIGGQDQMSYGDIMLEYSRQRHLKRWLIPVPVLTPWLSSLWLGLVTPIYARIGRKLIESLRFPTIVQDRRAEDLFNIHPIGGKEAIKIALANEDREFAQTHWSDSLSAAEASPNWAGARFGNRFIDSYTCAVKVDPEKAFIPISKIGGRTGWYYANSLWHIRGWLDLLLGGVGLRRGRRDQEHLRVGDFLDFWRVEAFEPNQRLLLRAEMKLPGRAWLEFIVEPTALGSLIHQRAIFDPLGIGGILYWYMLYPIHRLIFRGLIKQLARQAEQLKA